MFYWTTGEITLTFVGGKEANNAKIDTVQGNVGENIVLPENPTLNGYKFEGWYLDYAGNIPFVATTFSKDLILYAKWSKV